MVYRLVPLFFIILALLQSDGADGRRVTRQVLGLPLGLDLRLVNGLLGHIDPSTCGCARPDQVCDVPVPQVRMLGVYCGVGQFCCRKKGADAAGEVDVQQLRDIAQTHLNQNGGNLIKSLGDPNIVSKGIEMLRQLTTGQSTPPPTMLQQTVPEPSVPLPSPAGPQPADQPTAGKRPEQPAATVYRTVVQDPLPFAPVQPLAISQQPSPVKQQPLAPLQPASAAPQQPLAVPQQPNVAPQQQSAAPQQPSVAPTTSSSGYRVVDRPVQQSAPVYFNPNQPRIDSRVVSLEDLGIKDVNAFITPVASISYVEAGRPARVQTEKTGECECVPLNECSADGMDLSFGKSCPYGKVRCCTLKQQKKAEKMKLQNQAFTVSRERDEGTQGQVRPVNLPFPLVLSQQPPPSHSASTPATTTEATVNIIIAETVPVGSTTGTLDMSTSSPVQTSAISSLPIISSNLNIPVVSHSSLSPQTQSGALKYFPSLQGAIPNQPTQVATDPNQQIIDRSDPTNYQPIPPLLPPHLHVPGVQGGQARPGVYVHPNVFYRAPEPLGFVQSIGQTVLDITKSLFRWPFNP